MSRDQGATSTERQKQLEKTDAKKIIVLPCAMLFALCFLGTMLGSLSSPAKAQQPKKVPRIGYLTANLLFRNGPGSNHSGKGCALSAMSRGRTLSLSIRHTDGKFERLPDVAAELVRLKVDVLVANTTNARSSRQERYEDDSHLFMAYLILLRLGWLTASRGLGETSRD